ncbi:amino acid ABC transporter substrate-binding protein [Marinobacterium sediminicola]|uniref:Amino acid ABC transporter substrate-binding protein, PAAT family (TC 3.A.1.3.-) n=1 Tax=Marinobacterium sediminicola TaxID=518898 RepID=A0ABY1RYQ3_9GAMM|nr:amino acid ABC transporter substrate-binding protein [Marinobacterium sediminicola]ULG68048.1 amino acid ABC transporter substrate-binding protein [Marinobacterium sediminicola]SMR73442.1 amino acid ABC transporter substrate-binding protein, PAAT family (TC 3.A.1.3.-) [Marinobacterium sediminicola]
MLNFRTVASVALAASLLFGGAFAHADTLEEVKRHGDIRCGVFPDDPGRSAIDLNGEWQGFYVDFCRATAAALFGNPDRVQYVEVDATTRFTTLQHRQTDVVMYSTTWTIGRENRYQVAFPAIYLFDGQGVMVREHSGIEQLQDLSGKTVCVTENTSTHQNLVSVLARHKIDAQIQFSNGDSFFRGHCDAYSADRMNLATNRANRADDPKAYRLLPDNLSREPIGPMVRNDDPRWQRIIRAVVEGLILADEKRISRENVAYMRERSSDPEVQHLLGVTGDFGSQLGLRDDWAFQMLASVGNYGEIYQRHYGPGTPINVEPGFNQPWSRGGLLFAPLFR